MANKHNPTITFNERQQNIEPLPESQGTNAGGLINCNTGEANIVVDIENKTQLVEFAGIPNDFNYKHWFNIADTLQAPQPIKVLRPVHSSALNSSVKLNGISHLKTSDWYKSNDVRTLNKPSQKFYNSDVAEFALEEKYTTNSKLEIINKFVTTSKDLAISICSNKEHYDQSVFNNELEVIATFDQGQAPSNPNEFEKYTIARNKLNIVSVTDTGEIIVVSGDYTSILADLDKLVIEGNDVLNDGVVTIASMTYNSTLNQTSIVVSEDLGADTANLGTISYLLGDWRTEATFLDGVLVEYSNSAWGLVTLVMLKQYFIESLGKVYEWSGVIWNLKSNLSYIPVDINSDGKAEYAIEDIFSRDMLNADNSIKTFKDIYAQNLEFNQDFNSDNELIRDEILVLVFKKNVKTEKWEYKESHLGSTVRNSLDDNNNSFFIENVVYGNSKYIYAKIGETNEYTIPENANIEYTNTDATSSAVAITKLITLVNQDLTPYLKVGQTITIANTTSNDGDVTVVSYTLNGTNTEITVAEVILDETFDGLDETFTLVEITNPVSRQYINVDATSSAVASTKKLTFKNQDFTDNLVVGHKITIANTTSNNGDFTVASFIQNATDTEIVTIEALVDETFSGVDELINVSTGEILMTSENLQNFQVGEKLHFSGFTINAVANQEGILSLVDVAYDTDADYTSLKVSEDLLDYTLVVGTTKIDDSVSGYVSTNMNDYGNIRNSAYDVANANASEGFSVSQLIVYDTDPKNGSGTTITDYSDLQDTDYITAKEIFKNREVIDQDINLPYETIDEFGNHHQNGMSEVCEYLQDAFCPVAPFDESIFLGYENDEKKDNIIREFGNQRSSLFTGTFTKFGQYSSVFGWMKYIKDEYNNKFRYVPVSGDIARMLIEKDINPNTTVGTPIAGTEGVVNNQIKVSFLPNEDLRNDLTINSINPLYQNFDMTNPVIFSNINSYRIDNLFHIQSYRLVLNKIKKYIRRNVYPIYFKFNDETLVVRAREIFDRYLASFVTQGVFESASISYDRLATDPSNVFRMQIEIVPAGVVTQVIVDINMTESGITIEENV